MISPTCSPSRSAILMKLRCRVRRGILASVFVPCLLASGHVFAEPSEMGRLFYTPAQREQLETARTRNTTQRDRASQAVIPSAPPPQRYDGIVIRSDGKTTRWVDGKPEVGAPSVRGLKPGQTRADGKVYEPYQIVRPALPEESPPAAKRDAP